MNHPSGQFTALALSTFDDADECWRALYQTGISTLYQSPDWVHRFFKHTCTVADDRLCLILIKDPSGAPTMLLPLSVKRQCGVNVAEFIGGKHSNFNLPLFNSTLDQISSVDLRHALVDVGRRSGVDAFVLLQQPYEWNGVRNPMQSLDAVPSANQGFMARLNNKADADYTLNLSKNRRRKLQQKRKLLQRAGNLSYQRAQTAEEAQGVLSVFYRQKAARMQEQGIPNPFDEKEIQDFFAASVEMNDAGKNTNLEMHTLSLDDDIIAVYGLLTGGESCSALFTSFGGAADIIRHGPGLMLLHEIVHNLTERGFKHFDMGTGEAAYKTELCDERIPLFDSFIPVTRIGAMAAAVSKAQYGLKRAIKRSPRLMRLIHSARKIRAKQ